MLWLLIFFLGLLMLAVSDAPRILTWVWVALFGFTVAPSLYVAAVLLAVGAFWLTGKFLGYLWSQHEERSHQAFLQRIK